MVLRAARWSRYLHAPVSQKLSFIHQLAAIHVSTDAIRQTHLTRKNECMPFGVHNRSLYRRQPAAADLFDVACHGKSSFSSMCTM